MCGDYCGPSFKILHLALFEKIRFELYKVNLLVVNLRFSIFGQNKNFEVSGMASEQSSINENCSPASKLSFDTQICGHWLVNMVTGGS